jgi:hypothetical protein
MLRTNLPVKLSVGDYLRAGLSLAENINRGRVQAVLMRLYCTVATYLFLSLVTAVSAD